jgi:hypothetical protein
MKTAIWIGLVILLAALTLPVQGAAAGGAQGCYIDPAHGFSIYVPPDWTRRSFEKPDATIHEFKSPRPDAFIQLRIFPAAPGEDAAAMADSFQTNTFPSARRLSETGFTLNGAPGIMAVYRMRQDGAAVRVRAFYTVSKGRAFALWSAAPETAPESLHERLYRVFKTFSLTGTPLTPEEAVPPPVAETPGAVAVVDLKVGTRLADDFQVVPRNPIPDDVREILAVFRWRGNPNGRPFTMKWVNVSKNRVFRAFPVEAASGSTGWGKGSIVRGDRRWPLGQWAVEIHHMGSLLGRNTFAIVPE